MVMVGIVYSTSKSDDDEGLAFGQFLDSLVSLAFECETNVAGAMQVGPLAAARAGLGSRDQMLTLRLTAGTRMARTNGDCGE
jgi:hypothetical protein